MDHVRFRTRFFHAALLSTVVLLLQACSIGGQLLKEASTFKDVGKDEVIVVGTIELIPKLQKDEQQLDAAGVVDLFGYADMHRNRCMIQFDSQPQASDYKFMINPQLGETFFFKVPKNMKYMVEGNVLTEFTRHGNTGQIWLPIDFQINIRPEDKAVYIGKIKYTRDDFNSITKVELVDDYKKAAGKFRQKFGKKYKLRKVRHKRKNPLRK